MKTYNIELQGTAPYYFTKPTDDKTPKTEAAQIKVAKNRVYCNGNLYVPNRQIKWTMINAITMAKMKIEKSMKRAVDLFKTRLVTITPKEIYFQPKKNMDDIEILEHWVNLDMGKGKFCKYAVLTGNWSLDFNITIGSALEPEFVQEALNNAGLLCGIGGRRPENGTFDVIKFKET